MSEHATAATYPVQFAVDYPDRPLNRVTSGFRIFVAIPILIVLAAVSSGSTVLATSGALILMFAFLVLSTTPGYEIKPLAMGIAAGIIFDATVIRGPLVPSLMRLLGEANWWMPNWTRVALRMPVEEPEPLRVPESV